MRILLVDDHEDTNRIMQRLLRRLGYQVATAASVQQALAAAAGERFDVLISDVGLPDGTGLELVRELHRLQPITAIALSGHAMEDDIERSRQAGFHVHLTKPVDFERLEAILRGLATPSPVRDSP
jgi:CheY-like chemotaxis protein